MEIVYLSPAINVPIGGIKVIYRHSEMLNQLGFTSSVFHPDNPKFVCDWFTHQAKIRLGQTKWFRKKHEMYESIPFRPERDFLVIPEVRTSQIGRQCLERNLKYAMFVQNGYQLFDGGRSDLELLNQVYRNASVICSISEDTTEVIQMTFPMIDPDKIIRLYPHVSEIFRNLTTKKKKLITYMPRKLGKHAQVIGLSMQSRIKMRLGSQPCWQKVLFSCPFVSLRGVLCLLWRLLYRAILSLAIPERALKNTLIAQSLHQSTMEILWNTFIKPKKQL